jgi:hypothetical protein
MLDVVGASLAWLGDLILLSSVQGRVLSDVADHPSAQVSIRAIRSVAGIVWLLSAGAWCVSHGVAIGVACCVVASVVAAIIQRGLAASVPRLLIASGGIAAALALALLLCTTSSA